MTSGEEEPDFNYDAYLKSHFNSNDGLPLKQNEKHLFFNHASGHSLTRRLKTKDMKTSDEEKSNLIGNRLAISAIYALGLALILLQLRSLL